MARKFIGGGGIFYDEVILLAVDGVYFFSPEKKCRKCILFYVIEGVFPGKIFFRATISLLPKDYDRIKMYGWGGLHYPAPRAQRTLEHALGGQPENAREGKSEPEYHL